jgi:hypothetical protein
LKNPFCLKTSFLYNLEKQLNNDKGFNIEISKLLENKDFKDGWDLVDVLHDENNK